ncbi:hypothetical protein [uncultured Ruminococcus sp.]|uniref:hypothetical protein n=1 Tax=uncultured Ruminococcus sp. TaxID=165186 RepID=UPI0025FFEFAA|nr:hypothetical protein [uncultured Ruminococcus sp.]
MKKKAIIITFAAALCALTSCGKNVVSMPEMAASPADNTSTTRSDEIKTQNVNKRLIPAKKRAIKL